MQQFMFIDQRPKLNFEGMPSDADNNTLGGKKERGDWGRVVVASFHSSATQRPRQQW
jgi:hypothetical protein